MLTYKGNKFRIDGKEATQNAGRCIKCARPTILVKDDRKAYRVGCVCPGGVDFRALRQGRFVRAN